MRFAYRRYDTPETSPLDGAIEVFRPDQDEVLLLGQSGFLQFFDVRFCGAEYVVELKPNTKFPRPHHH